MCRALVGPALQPSQAQHMLHTPAGHPTQSSPMYCVALAF